MRQIPPSIEGLESLLTLCLPLGISEKELEELCRSEGVDILELPINRRKVRLARRDAVYAAMARRMAPAVKVNGQERLRALDEKIGQIQSLVQELMATRGQV